MPSAPWNLRGLQMAGTGIVTASWRVCNTTPMMWSFTVPIRFAECGISVLCAREGKWRKPWATRRAQASIDAFSNADRAGLILTSLMVSSTFRRLLAAERIKLLPDYVWAWITLAKVGAQILKALT